VDEAEQLADRIAILHGGRIIVDGTLAELTELLPPATVEYIEKQPTLQDVFLAFVGDGGRDVAAGTIRSLLAQERVGGGIWVALAWCVGTLVVAYGCAMVIDRRRAA
jgi:ABC-type multidrug transport system ATPase subunit